MASLKADELVAVILKLESMLERNSMIQLDSHSDEVSNPAAVTG